VLTHDIAEAITQRYTFTRASANAIGDDFGGIPGWKIIEWARNELRLRNPDQPPHKHTKRATQANRRVVAPTKAPSALAPQGAKGTKRGVKQRATSPALPPPARLDSASETMNEMNDPMVSAADAGLEADRPRQGRRAQVTAGGASPLLARQTTVAATTGAHEPERLTETSGTGDQDDQSDQGNLGDTDIVRTRSGFAPDLAAVPHSPLRDQAATPTRTCGPSALPFMPPTAIATAFSPDASQQTPQIVTAPMNVSTADRCSLQPCLAAGGDESDVSDAGDAGDAGGVSKDDEALALADAHGAEDTPDQRRTPGQGSADLALTRPDLPTRWAEQVRQVRAVSQDTTTPSLLVLQDLLLLLPLDQGWGALHRNRWLSAWTATLDLVVPTWDTQEGQ